ncbi:MAG: TolC family protein [Flavisolibacter sp.]|nr:TolC family protein [Flavisolibacter sp.]
MISMLKRHLCFLAASFFATISINAQDSLKLTLPEAENLFVRQNLSLLSEKYNISIARAQVIQARLYNNPNFQFTGNIYNPELKKVFDVTNKTGEYIIGAQQLILLAGKRNKQIKVAETNATLAENRFFDLLRTLRFTLRSDFYQAFFLLNSINAYKTQVTSLEQLNRSFEQLLAKGVVTLKDAVRIKSLLYSLKAEQASLQNQFNDVNAEMQLLLHSNQRIVVPLSNIDVASLPPVKQLSLPSLIDSAYANRYDLKLAQNTILLDQQNYSLQKALATPDLTVGGQFDKRGSFVNDASFFTLAIDLPFFNRNQGNIKAAKLSIDQSKLLLEKQTEAVQNDVQHAYVNALNTDNILQSVDPNFRNQFEELLISVTKNFEKRNISLLEFTDFYDTYKQNILQLNQLQNARMQAIENLNFAIGKTIINY